MQDEVHRFAITFHKDLRKKKMTESILENIPGLGKKRIEILNKAYSDINTLKEASLEELQQFLPLNVAINVYEKLHK
jgi:excinuclease ABC subunit C